MVWRNVGKEKIIILQKEEHRLPVAFIMHWRNTTWFLVRIQKALEHAVTLKPPFELHCMHLAVVGRVAAIGLSLQNCI